MPEVARTVLSTMGFDDVRIEVARTEAQVLAGVAAGRFDLVGGLSVRADLRDRLEYSIPDTVSGAALIVPEGLLTYAEVVASGATIAVVTGLPKHRDALAAGVASADIVPLPVPHQLVDAVRDGQADCAAFDDITSRDLARVVGDGEVTTADPFPPPGRGPVVGAYAFPPARAGDLVEPFNAALHDSVEWLSIVEPYGFTSANDPPGGLSTEQLCTG